MSQKKNSPSIDVLRTLSSLNIFININSTSNINSTATNYKRCYNVNIFSCLCMYCTQ